MTVWLSLNPGYRCLLRWRKTYWKVSLLYRKTAIKLSKARNRLPPVGSEETGTMLPKDQLSSWAQFYDSARHNEILDEKTTILIHLAVAMSVGCYP